MDIIMKLIGTLAGTVLCAALTGCGESKPPANPAAMETAGDAMRNDDRAIAQRLAEQKTAVESAYRLAEAAEERQKAIDAVNQVIKRWDGAVEVASSTKRTELEGPVKQLQAIKGEAEAMPVNDCTGIARATLVNSMNTTMEAIAMFRKETDKASEATKEKHNNGADLLAESAAQLSKCK